MIASALRLLFENLPFVWGWYGNPQTRSWSPFQKQKGYVNSLYFPREFLIFEVHQVVFERTPL